MDDEMDRQTQEIIQRTRHLIDGLVNQFGEAVMLTKDFDRALQLLTLAIDGSHASREQLTVAVAFAARRLWYKRSDAVKFSVN